MMNFNTKDLLRHAEAAGFEQLRIQLFVEVEPGSWVVDWGACKHVPEPQRPYGRRGDPGCALAGGGGAVRAAYPAARRRRPGREAMGGRLPGGHQTRVTAEIETPRLLLRPLTEDDEEHFVTLFADPRVTRYIALTEERMPKQGAMKELQENLARWRKYDYGPWSAIHKETGRWIGKSISASSRIGQKTTRRRYAGSSIRPSGARDWPPKEPGQRSGTGSPSWSSRIISVTTPTNVAS
jgi:Acetyltransferase (GNAT) domain